MSTSRRRGVTLRVHSPLALYARLDTEFTPRVSHQLFYNESTPSVNRQFTARLARLTRARRDLIPASICALPTETRVESGTSQSKSGTSVNLSNSGILGLSIYSTNLYQVLLYYD